MFSIMNQTISSNAQECTQTIETKDKRSINGLPFSLFSFFLSFFLSFFFVSLFVCFFIPFVCLGVPVRFIAIPLNAIHWKSAHRLLRCGPVANAGRPRHLISILNQHRLITSGFHWLLIVFNHVVFHVLNDVRLMINSARGRPVENANCTRQLFGSLGGWCLFDLDWSVWVWFHRADWKVEEKQPKKK